MKTDSQLKADVIDELAWDPAVNAAGICVMVADGVVTLTGHLAAMLKNMPWNGRYTALRGYGALPWNST